MFSALYMLVSDTTGPLPGYVRDVDLVYLSRMHGS